MGRICQQLGKPMIFHSDGDITALLDLIIEAHFSGIHPIDPNAMEINQVKKKYGDRLALLGNINMDFPLSRGKPSDVEELVIERISELAPGGGYILSSSNSVAEYIPLKNYQAMLAAGHKYGKYPIMI
jgi:uroporphyrinogen decarboxylase